MALEEPDFPKVVTGHTDVITLSRYKSRPDFISGLMDTINGRSAPSDDDAIRLSASIYLEKTITRYWENSLFISDYEKTNLRNKLLSHWREENDQIAQVLGIIISKIALFDYPREWPELFSVLAMGLEEWALDTLTSHRILEVLSRTILILSKRDLRVEGMSFAEISSQLFDPCWKLWQIDAAIVLEHLKTQPSVVQELDQTFERWLLCSSVVQMLIKLGFRSDAKSVKVPPVESVCRAFIKTVKFLFNYECTNYPKPLLDTNICVALMKCLVEIQQWRLTSFDDETVRVSFEFCLAIIMGDRHNISDYGEFLPFPVSEPLLIECMVMVKSVFECTSNDTLIPGLKLMHVWMLCDILITRYFLLSGVDLEKWSQDPERFFHETKHCCKMDRITKKLRPHAEALYNVLFIRYENHLRPVVCNILRGATNDCPAYVEESRPKMILREAAYTAVAHVCHRFFGKYEFFFKKLLEEVLCPELRNHHPNMRILHWKIAFIVQNWAFKLEDDMRKPVFRDLCELLKYDDLVVKLAACQPLRSLLAVIDFQEEDSMDMLRSYWDLSLKLLVAVQDFRSKDLVLDSVLSGLINIGKKNKKKSVIVKIGESITPFAGKLVDEIEKAWNVSSCKMAFQFKVLQALHCLIEHGIHIPVCYKILLPVLKMCIVVDDPDRHDLFMDGMLLWETTLSHAPSMDSQLLELFPYLQLVVEKSFVYFPPEIDHINDRLKVASEIISGYIKLGGRTFWTAHSSVIHELLDGFSGNLNAIQERFSDGGQRKMKKKVFDFVASIAGSVKGLNTDEIEGRLNIDNVDRDDGCERPEGQSMFSIKEGKWPGKFRMPKDSVDPDDGSVRAEGQSMFSFKDGKWPGKFYMLKDYVGPDDGCERPEGQSNLSNKERKWPGKFPMPKYDVDPDDRCVRAEGQSMFSIKEGKWPGKFPMPEDDVDSDDGCGRLKGQSWLSIKKQKWAGEFPAFGGKLNSGKLKDTKTSVELHEDEKNTGALDEIKKRYGWFSSSES